MWLLTGWLVLLLLQWSLIFVAHAAAAITATAWSLFVVKTQFKKQETPSDLDALFIMGLLLVTGATLAFVAPNVGFSLWVAVQTVTFFYFAHQQLPELDAKTVLCWIMWGLYVLLTFKTTFAAYSSVAWLPKALYDVPLQVAIALGVISVVGSYVQEDSYETEAAAGALLALNFCSVVFRRAA